MTRQTKKKGKQVPLKVLLAEQMRIVSAVAERYPNEFEPAALDFIAEVDPKCESALGAERTLVDTETAMAIFDFYESVEPLWMHEQAMVGNV